MPRIAVDTGSLSSGADTQQQVAADVSATTGPLHNAMSTAAGGSGEPAAASAALTLGDTMGTHLQALSQAIGSMATNVASAGSAYTETDNRAMPGVPR